VTDGKNTFIPWSQGTGLNCVSPDDFEDFLKNCKNGTYQPVTQCTINMQSMQFICTMPDKTQYPLELSKADNYFCFNARDQKRIIQRCHKLY
jgi:hypothetical protein